MTAQLWVSLVVAMLGGGGVGSALSWWRARRRAPLDLAALAQDVAARTVEHARGDLAHAHKEIQELRDEVTRLSAEVARLSGLLDRHGILA